MKSERWRKRLCSIGVGVGLVCAVAGGAPAQSCVTQARLAPATRDAIADAALVIASSVKANDAAGPQAAAVPEFAANFSQTAATIHAVAARLDGDTLAVTQIYQLDASARKAGDSSEADFSCPLTGSTSETDFSIEALPPGSYAFAMVEAKGTRPYLLSILLRQQGGSWKLAGLYPRARTAAGHDGLWFWTAARDDSKAKQPWFSWLLYGEADELLRPANFVTSTNLDKLRGEERLATPPGLSDGISAQTPFVLTSNDGATFRFTQINAEGSDDGKRLNLMLHYTAEPAGDAAAAKARNLAAAKAFLDAHVELRQGFDGVWIFAESPAGSSVRTPFATEQTMSSVP